MWQNSMVFRQCSIGGKVYKGDSEKGEGDELLKPPLEEKLEDQLSRTTSVSASASGSGSRPPTGQEIPNTTDDRDSSTRGQRVKLSEGVLAHFHDSTLQADIDALKNAEPQSETDSFARVLNAFWSSLALCHTALASVDPHTGAIEYKAQSPDEAALVQAAADAGFVFCGRDREILSLRTPFTDEVEKYELLNILEFNSARKRMSVVVRRLNTDDSRILLLTKGADNVIFERLQPGFDDFKKITEEQLDEFASNGLRTLTLAYRVIPGELSPALTLSVCAFKFSFRE